MKFGWWTIPNTLGAILFILIIFCIIRNWKAKDIRIAAILLILTFVLVLTHSFSSFYLLVMLVGTFITTWMYLHIIGEKRIEMTRAVRNYILFFSVLLFAWWTYASFNIDILANYIHMGFYSPDKIVFKTTHLIYTQAYSIEKILMASDKFPSLY